MKKYIIISSILLLTVLIYFILGGFKSIDKNLKENTETQILGVFYKGIIGSDSLQNLFMQARNIAETEANATSIAIVYYGDTNPETGAVNNFIGVTVEDKLSRKPEKWEYRVFKAEKSVKGCIEANVLAMPTPEDMLEELREYAKEKNMKADSVFIEYYLGPNNLCVELLGKI